MLWWNLEADHQWTWILKNATKKINLSNIKKRQIQVTMNPLKEKEIEIVQNQIMMNFQYERTKNLWSQYFRDGKTESDLIKERPPFLLQRKLSIIFWKYSERKEHTLKIKDQEGNVIEQMI